MAGEDRNIRVLHVYRTYFPDTQGGGEEVIRQICHNTQTLGVESRVYTLSPHPSPQPLQREEAIVYQARSHLEISSCGISFSPMGQFRELAEWADVLHYHFPWPFGDLLQLLNRDLTSKPTVISYLSDVIRQKLLFFFYQPLMRKFLSTVNVIVATSPNYVASSKLLQSELPKVKVIPIGVDEQQLPRVSADLVVRYQNQYGPRFLFFVGVFRYYKGLQFLLEAAKSTSATIVIAGSGPEEQALKQFKQDNRLDNVHFVGRVSDAEKMSYLAACRAFVFPSHLPSESFGISLLEAAMMGKPMISCEIGTGTTYVNKDNETGLVVPPANSQALAEAIDTLATNDVLAEQLGIGARNRYEQLFTGEKMGQQYAALYRELLSANRAGAR